LFLAACGTTTNRPIRIVAARITEAFPVYLCSALGHFRQEGVEVSIEEFASGNKLVESLLSGSADVVFNSYMQTIQMGMAGRPLRSFFVSAVAPVALLVASPSKGERIKRIEDLRGTTIGVAGFATPQQEILTYILFRHGLRVRDVKLVAYGTGPAAIASLERSQVDAGIVTGSTFELLRRRAPGVRVLADTRTREGMKSVYGFDAWANHCLYSTPEWISRNTEPVGRMVHAMQKTHSWLQAHTAEEVLERLPAQFHSDIREADLATLRVLMASLSNDGRMPAGAPENILHMLASSMENAPKLDPSTTWTNEFLGKP
jgi:NitT/TauT family transport system substrate-binding protein